MVFKVVKTYPHTLGLSACFRQWRAKSHCRFLHGYPMAVELTFCSDVLDDNNWVIDFGRLRPVKVYLQDLFDHNTLVAEDDPLLLSTFQELHAIGMIRLKVVKSTGCEAFASQIYEWVNHWLPEDCVKRGVGLESVKVSEHGGNSAIFSPPRGRFLGWDIAESDVRDRSPIRERVGGAGSVTGRAVGIGTKIGETIPRTGDLRADSTG